MPICSQCSTTFTQSVGRGRPRRYCPTCRPSLTSLKQPQPIVIEGMSPTMIRHEIERLDAIHSARMLELFGSHWTEYRY